MKVLVTGATGFLGGHLVRRLVERGDDVRALARKTSNVDKLKNLDVEIFYGDLADKDSLRHAVDDVDIVYHAAATIRGGWDEAEEGNVKGTIRMLKLSLDAGVRRFVYISSLAVYGVNELENNTLVKEESPYEKFPDRLGSAYVYSKTEAEKLVFKFYKKGLPVVVLRPGIIYGPGGKVFFSHIGYPYKERFFVFIGNGDISLPLTYVDNTVDAILLSAEREEAIGRIYNIVDAELTQKEYLNRYIEGINLAKKTFTVPVPFPLISSAAYFIETLTNFLNKGPRNLKYKIAYKGKNLRFDTSKAKEELSWRPRVSLEDGLKTTFDWYNSTVKLKPK